MIEIQENVPLAPFHLLRYRGAGPLFRGCGRAWPSCGRRCCSPAARGSPWAILGGGTNLLVSDGGFDGLVIRLNMAGVRMSGCQDRGGGGGRSDRAGARHGEARSMRHGVAGGDSGARGWRGARQRRGLRQLHRRGHHQGRSRCTRKPWNSSPFPADECAFAYRSSRFKRDPGLIVVSALLYLSPGDAAQRSCSKVEATMAKRTAKGAAV